MVDYITVVKPLYEMQHNNTNMGLAIDACLQSMKETPLRWGNKEIEDALDAARIGGTPSQIATLIKVNRKQGHYDALIVR